MMLRSGSGLSVSASDRHEKVKARDLKGSLKKLFGYLGLHKVTLIFAVLFAVGSTAANIFGPLLLGQAITLLAQGSPIDLVRIGQIAVLALGLYLLSALLSYVQSWIMAGLATNITYRFRREISEKINRLPLKYFDATPAGEVLSRLTNDADTVNQSLSQSLTQIIVSAVTLIGVLIMMLTINVFMTLIALITIPLSMIAGGLIIRQSQKFFGQQQAYLGQVNGQVEEMVGGHMVVRAFNGMAQSLQKFEVANRLLYETKWKAGALSGLMMPLMTFIGNLGPVLVTVIGGWLAVQGIAVGAILAFIQYLRSFTQPITQLANISNILQQTAAAAERVFEFLAEPEMSRYPASHQLEKATGRVEFKDVHFGYNPQQPIIKAFSAEIQPGQKIAIVGLTGAGKTTMVKLLMRFYDVNTGAILVDGHDVRDFTAPRSAADVRHGPAGHLVVQRHHHGQHPLRPTRRHRRRSLAAARAAHVDHFVHTLPDGYNLLLNEEASNLSQGQSATADHLPGPCWPIRAS